MVTDSGTGTRIIAALSSDKTVDQLLEETEQVFQKRYDNDLLNINKER